MVNFSLEILITTRKNLLQIPKNVIIKVFYLIRCQTKNIRGNIQTKGHTHRRDIQTEEIYTLRKIRRRNAQGGDIHG